MKIKEYIFIAATFTGTISCNADNLPINIPPDDKQRLPIKNINFNGSDFFAAYMSKNLLQRRLAEMYLVGVLDSTEGKSWCSYKVALPGSIQEQIYSALKSANKDVLDRRASEIITSVLSEKLPCKEE